MTIIETEAPAVTKVEDPATTLIRTARDNYASGKWKWLRRIPRDNEGGFCISGALYEAGGYYETHPTGLPNWWETTYGKAYKRVQKALDAESDYYPIRWNDAIAGSVDDVIRVLDKALEVTE